MNDEILETEELTEEGEPLTPDSLLTQLVADCLQDEPAEILAEEFVKQFVETNRPETPQILAILDLPDATILDVFAQMQAQTLEQLQTKAPAYLAQLRVEIAGRIAELK
jgi:hypothetical protein